MKRTLRRLLKKNWLDMVLAPLLVMGWTYVIYGNAYFDSWQNFLKMTVPWELMALCVGTVMNTMTYKTDKWFPRAEQWATLIIIHTICGVIINVVFFNLFWFGLKKLPFPEIHPPADRYYAAMVIVIGSFICMLVAYSAFAYFEKWKGMVSETEELEKLTLESQFRSLQSQLNPHFLFNSLNVLSSLISESPSRAEHFVDELSNVYRYLLRSNEKELATVADELRFIGSFAHLLETRHDSGISLNIKVSKENMTKKLPALALQVLVENAVKHNEISPEKPLKIEIGDVGGALFVRNNIQQKATKPQSNQIGLSNLLQRYNLLGVKGFRVLEDGKVFEVVLPILAEFPNPTLT